MNGHDGLKGLEIEGLLSMIHQIRHDLCDKRIVRAVAQLIHCYHQLLWMKQSEKKEEITAEKDSKEAQHERGLITPFESVSNKSNASFSSLCSSAESPRGNGAEGAEAADAGWA